MKRWQVHDELGYVAIPPCLWGEQEVQSCFIDKPICIKGIQIKIHSKSKPSPDMCLGRPLSANLPPLQHQLDVDQEEQQHKHPLRGDGDVADEGGDGQLQVRRVVESEEKEEIGGKRESKQIRICQSMNIFEVSQCGQDKYQ